MCAACSAGYPAHIVDLAAKVYPRALVEVQGSGNFGESGAAAFYTIDELPKPLLEMTSTAPTPLRRTDLDLGPDRLAFHIDEVLSADEADALAACAESILELNGHSRLAPGINTPPGMRVNEAAHWYPTRAGAAAFAAPLFARIKHLVPPALGGLPLHGALSEKVGSFKYGDGDEFKRHVDGLFPGQGCNEQGDGIDEWHGVVGGMSMLLFLNDAQDGLVGGATRLWDASGTRSVDVPARKGRALFFRRGSPDAVLHAGLRVSGPVPKYIALMNLAYGTRRGTEPLYASRLVVAAAGGGEEQA